MIVSKFKIIMDVETNLSQDELVHLLDEKLSKLVHDVYKAEEGADTVSLDVGVDHIALTGQQNNASVA